MSDRTEGMELLVEEGPIRAVYAEGQGTDLVISFSSIGQRRHLPPAHEFIGAAIGADRRHVLFVTDFARSWANAPEFAPALIAAVARVRARHDITRITALGYSMGGFSALAAQSVLPLDGVLAISPQYSILRRLIGSEDRWLHWRKQIARPLAFPVAPLPGRKAKTQVTLLHGMVDDAAHALAFEPRRGVDHFLFPERTHSDLGRHLKATGQLGPLIDAAIAGDRRAVARAARRAGGDFRARILAREAAARSHSAP